MDRDRFDGLAKSWGQRGGSRRGAMRALVGGVLGVTAAPPWGRLGAVGARERADRGPVAGEVGIGRQRGNGGKGCQRVGRTCERNAECCSGRCRGPKDKQTCRAHGVGTCKRGQNFCTQGSAATACNDTDNCFCFTTTGGAPFCADVQSRACARCDEDLDCTRQGFEPGRACLRFTGDNCGNSCADRGGTICAAPCGAETLAG